VMFIETLNLKNHLELINRLFSVSSSRLLMEMWKVDLGFFTFLLRRMKRAYVSVF
jgi:hypothetical protein